MPRRAGPETLGGTNNEQDDPIGLVIVTFRDERTAMHALAKLKTEPSDRIVGIPSGAVPRKDKTGKLHIKETADIGSARGASIGGVIGAVIGVVAGAALAAPAAVEALIGGLAAKLRDSDFPSARLHGWGKDLRPGAAAIITVVEPSLVGQVERDLKGAGADAFTEELDADIAAQLEAGHDVAYNALVTREGLAMRRIAGSPEEIVGGMLVADDAGVTSSQFTSTEEGFAVRAINVTTKEPSP